MLKLDRLQQLREKIGDCHRCKLGETRTNLVYYSGRVESPMFICGEAPGQDEDRQGMPFVGRSGDVLDAVLNSMGWDRKKVFVSNVLQCRPPGNRPPERDEVEACGHFLAEKIEIVQPRVIIGLGLQAMRFLLGPSGFGLTMTKMRQKDFNYKGIPLIPTFHPSYILRGGLKEIGKMHEDFGKALAILLSENILPPNMEKMAPWASNILQEVYLGP